MGMLMNVILTVAATASGNSSQVTAVTTTSFETYDEIGCKTTAQLMLGSGAFMRHGQWHVSANGLETTLICFPKSSGDKPMIPRGIQQ
jgi:hypothetical protein